MLGFESKIAKITKADENKMHYEGIAEGCTYHVVSARDLNAGDYVKCFIIASEPDDLDEADFYMEDANDPLYTEAEYIKQEKLFNV